MNNLQSTKLANTLFRSQYPNVPVSFSAYGSSLYHSYQTPMSTLNYTPITPVSASFSNHSHTWFRYPVAIAGHVIRSHASGTGFFKLQLQCVVGLSYVLSLVGRWSCNLKENISDYVELIDIVNPDDDVAFASSFGNIVTKQHPAAYSHPVASAGYNSPTLSSRVGSFK